MENTNFSKKIGTRTVLSVSNKYVSIVKHKSSGMVSVDMPITSFLQAASELSQYLMDDDLDNDFSILVTPYVNRAIQHGSSVLTMVKSADLTVIMEAIESHPKGKALRCTPVVREFGKIYDIVINLIDF